MYFASLQSLCLWGNCRLSVLVAGSRQEGVSTPTHQSTLLAGLSLNVCHHAKGSDSRQLHLTSNTANILPAKSYSHIYNLCRGKKMVCSITKLLSPVCGDYCGIASYISRVSFHVTFQSCAGPLILIHYTFKAVLCIYVNFLVVL